MFRSDVLPMDGSAYRRLDRISAVVVDGAALCTGPAIIVEATGEADGWDDARIWTAAARLLGSEGAGDPDEHDTAAGNGGPQLRLGPGGESGGPPGGEERAVYEGGRRVGSVIVAA